MTMEDDQELLPFTDNDRVYQLHDSHRASTQSRLAHSQDNSAGKANGEDTDIEEYTEGIEIEEDLGDDETRTER